MQREREMRFVEVNFDLFIPAITWALPVHIVKRLVLTQQRS